MDEVSRGLAPIIVKEIYTIVRQIDQTGTTVILNTTIGSGLMPPLVITFGLSIIAQNLLQLQFSADSQGLDAGSLETQSITISDQLSIGIMPLITFIVAVLVLFGLQLFFNRTKLGQAFRATSDDPQTAELMGINSGQIYAIAMGISFAIVAIAGILLGIRTNFAPPTDPPASSSPSKRLSSAASAVFGAPSPEASSSGSAKTSVPKSTPPGSNFPVMLAPSSF